MSWLFLDTHTSGTFTWGWIPRSGRALWKTKKGKASQFLVAFARLGRSARKHLGGVCVVAGPGSFSAVRTGVLHANLLARLLKVPLVSLRADQASLEKEDVIALLRRGDLSPTVYAAPLYDREPNITFPTA